MKLNAITKGLNLEVENNELEFMNAELKKFLANLSSFIKKKKIKADVFVGGSFAKKTMIKSNNYDIDIFVRFHKDEDISDALESVIKETKMNYQRVHGSRDYFQVRLNDKITFEVIPILKINKPKEAKNVTDLSYFHVNYVKKKINDNIAREIRVAKQFLKAQGIYGAESYIGGISGYGVECLIINYKTLDNFAKQIVRAEDKIIIDIEKMYKGKDVLIEMNESKLESPIVLVDPTFKERNVLAALKIESFNKLKEVLGLLLKNPKRDMFEIREIDLNKLKNKAQKLNAELVRLKIFTDRQEGDIAGTKMKKFSEFLVEEIKRYLEVYDKQYVYSGGKNSKLYLIVKPLKEIIRRGPPLEMIESAKRFRKEHKSTIMKAGILYAKIQGYRNFKDFFKEWKIKNKNKIEEMDITNVEID